jgi:hypothetical protein
MTKINAVQSFLFQCVWQLLHMGNSNGTQSTTLRHLASLLATIGQHCQQKQHALMVWTLSMHLQSAEGTSINDTDIQKATKVLLLTPHDIDMLGKQLEIFSVVCAAILGSKADLVRELQDWVTHMTKHETTY